MHARCTHNTQGCASQGSARQWQVGLGACMRSDRYDVTDHHEFAHCKAPRHSRTSMLETIAVPDDLRVHDTEKLLIGVWQRGRACCVVDAIPAHPQQALTAALQHASGALQYDVIAATKALIYVA